VSPELLFPAWNVAPLSKLYVSPAFWTVIEIAPVATAHVGCVTAMTGADGVEGCAFITTFTAVEEHPAAFVTMKL
jgi:hypothetical protein